MLIRCQTITQGSADLSTKGTQFSEIKIKIQSFLLKKKYFQIEFANGSHFVQASMLKVPIMYTHRA